MKHTLTIKWLSKMRIKCEGEMGSSGKEQDIENERE